MIDALLTVTILIFGVAAFRARRLLASALWLAGVSALLSILFYRLGAPQVAVIELSVGAGLVTVLFVFAISVAGDEGLGAQPLVGGPVALVLALVAVVLLASLVLPAPELAAAGRRLRWPTSCGSSAGWTCSCRSSSSSPASWACWGCWPRSGRRWNSRQPPKSWPAASASCSTCRARSYIETTILSRPACG